MYLYERGVVYTFLYAYSSYFQETTKDCSSNRAKKVVWHHPLQ